MKRYIFIAMAVLLIAACDTKVEQPKAGTGIGEIYLTAPAGSMTVSVEIEGLWRVTSLEDWMTLDVNGRDGRGAFSFSYTSNESDFANVRMTRLGHIVIQSIPDMRADTLYVRQQGTPDGRDYKSVDKGTYIEFPDTDLMDVNVVYANLDGAFDARQIADWMVSEDIDILAAVCPDGFAEELAGLFQETSVRSGNLIVAGRGLDIEEVSGTDSPASLTVSAAGVHYVVADFLKELPQDASRYAQMQALLDGGYNYPGNTGKWVLGGSLWFYSVMETGYGFTPSWYPSDPQDKAFDADLYAWRNNLMDCLWMVNRDFTPTWIDPEGKNWRPDYVYVSNEAWNAAVAVEVSEVPVASMTHKPIRLTLKY